MTPWVFYSSKSGNTAKLFEHAGLSGLRIPQSPEESLVLTHPFILVTPSFGDAQGVGAVPKAVIRFLNNPLNRMQLRAVVACGDRNFGQSFAQAGALVAQKCNVPLLHRVELFGSASDHAKLQTIQKTFLNCYNLES